MMGGEGRGAEGREGEGTHDTKEDQEARGKGFKCGESRGMREGTAVVQYLVCKC